MRITSKGQVTIPQAIRERAGLLPNTEVEFLMDGDVVTLVKPARCASRDPGDPCGGCIACLEARVPDVHRGADGADARRVVTPVLVDLNVLTDVITSGAAWGAWSDEALRAAHETSVVVINPIVYGAVSIGFESIEALDAALPEDLYRREGIPYPAAFLAGKAPLPIDSAAGPGPRPCRTSTSGPMPPSPATRQPTRDPARYRASFPRLELIAPD